MSEKLITVKTSKLVEKGDNKWVELVDHEDKAHRIFASMQSNDGQWLHFDLSQYENSAGKSFKLIKEKKGQFWNVTAIEPVTNILEKEAIIKVAKINEDTKEASIEAQVAFKGIMEAFSAGKLGEPHPTVHTALGWAMLKMGGDARWTSPPIEIIDRSLPSSLKIIPEFNEAKVKQELKESGITQKEVYEILVNTFKIPKQATLMPMLNELYQDQSKWHLFMTEINKQGETKTTPPSKPARGN